MLRFGVMETNRIYITRFRPTGWVLGAPQAYKWSSKDDLSFHITQACRGSEQSPNYPKPAGNQLEPPKYIQNLQNQPEIEDFAKSSWNSLRRENSPLLKILYLMLQNRKKIACDAIYNIQTVSFS